MAKARSIVITAMAALLVAAAPAPVPREIPVAILVDLSTGQHLFEREIHRRFMPASTTKVMTAFTAFRLIEEGHVNTSMPVLVSQELEDEWSGEGSSMFLKAGDRPTFGELLLGATTVSGNDASVALALASTGSVANWLELMNSNAAELGMRDTHFGSANGFPDGGQTFSTASDMALLAEALVTRYPDLYHRYFGHRALNWRGLVQQNHDPLTGQVPGGDGIKTGFTNEAGYTFVGSGERDGRRLVMVLAASPTGRLRDETARALLEWGFSDFTLHGLADEGQVIGEAQVQAGNSRKVSLRAGRPIRVAVPNGTSPQMRTTIRYQGPLIAPIAAGDRVASLHVEIDGLPAYDIPLEAAGDVPRANPFQRLFNGIAGVFS